jgi:hypothetical protein
MWQQPYAYFEHESQRRQTSSVGEMTLLHFLEEIKEIAVGGTTSSILYNCVPKLIITLWGLDSYTSCHFHKYG